MAKQKLPFNPNPGPGAEYVFGVLVSAFENEHGPLADDARQTMRNALRQAFLMASYSVEIELQSGRVQGGKTRGAAVTMAAKKRHEQIVAAYKELRGIDREGDRVKAVSKLFQVHPNTVRNAIRDRL
jgi:hypothetical protein